MIQEKQTKLIINRDKRTIEGVSILSAGLTLNGFAVDLKTLSQGFELLQSKPSPVYIDHETEDKPHTPDNIIGVIGAAYIDGEILRGTLTFLKSFAEGEETKEQYARLMELAETNPEIFGLSIFYDGGHVTIDADTNEETPALKEDKPEERFLRLSNLFSCDFVSIPAANPQGLSKAEDANPILSDQTKQILMSITLNDDQVKVLKDHIAFLTTLIPAEEAPAAASTEDKPVEEVKTDEVKALSAKVADLETKIKTAKLSAGVQIDLGEPSDTPDIKAQYKAIQAKGDFRAALSFYRANKAALCN
jgi:hypothetical protein